MSKVKEYIKQFMKGMGIILLKGISLGMIVMGIVNEIFLLALIGLGIFDLTPSYVRFVWNDVYKAYFNPKASSEVKK